MKYRRSSQDKTTNKEIVVEDNNHIDLMAENDICDDIRIKNVLILYNVVRKVVIERDYEYHDSVAADLTEEILETKNYYSTISSRTIHRWYLSCGRKKNRGKR